MLSIDQNCHSLWDVVPKLHALKSAGHRVRHCIEDIDVAFTALGSTVDVANIRLARERFHRGGGEDWGAALFYAQFLGRLPVDIRRWEPQVGMAMDALGRRLGLSLDELYARFSPGDVWQLIGSSYVGDRQHHRVIGDVRAGEVRDHVTELIEIAWADCMERFPRPDAQKRVDEWFERERLRVLGLLEACAESSLVELYRQWLREHVPDVELDATSSLFACGDCPRGALADLFVRRYDQAADAYNKALAEAPVGLRPLRTDQGELPIFATFEHRGRLVRAGAFLAGGRLRIGQMDFALAHDGAMPADKMREAGIRAVAGKALLLVLQVRTGESGERLAVPHRGSVYMPAVHALERRLRAAGLLTEPVQPLVRVRLGLLDHLRGIETVVRLPEHLRRVFGRDEVSASEIGRHWADISAEARRRLAAMRDENFRRRWCREALPDVRREMDDLDARRRELARGDQKNPELRRLWKLVKPLRDRLLRALVEQVALDHQVSDMDYWDSRGAVLPWCVAMGGRELYERVICQARITEESADHA